MHTAPVLDGACTCSAIRYRLHREPLFVHCCHCRWCQRESGASFALNALIETRELELLQGRPVRVPTPSNSGKGQQVMRCGDCGVALWSHYAGAGEALAFVRVGTLAEPDRCTPDVHIFTASKQPWVVLPAGTPAFEAYYDRQQLWPQASLRRREALLAS